MKTALGFWLLALGVACVQSPLTQAESIAERTYKDPCADAEVFAQSGWEHEEVQNAIDAYMQEHKMRANWLNQPAPPDQIGRDYYYWLWHNSFGARMKSELTGQFCGGAHPHEY